jgi:hypothetical protein
MFMDLCGNCGDLGDEEYSPKWKMRTEIKIILKGQKLCDKVLSARFLPR